MKWEALPSIPGLYMRGFAPVRGGLRFDVCYLAPYWGGRLKVCLTESNGKQSKYDLKEDKQFLYCKVNVELPDLPEGFFKERTVPSLAEKYNKVLDNHYTVEEL